MLPPAGAEGATAGLVGEVGTEGGQRRRGDQDLLGRRADQGRVGVVGGEGRAAGIDQEAGAVGGNARVQRGLEVLRADRVDDRLRNATGRPEGVALVVASPARGLSSPENASTSARLRRAPRFPR